MATLDEETEAAAIQAAQEFQARRILGRVLLLPSDIDNKVLISVKEGGCYSNSKDVLISCVLKPKKRTINVMYAVPPRVEVTTPRILFSYQTNVIPDSENNKGYYFLYKRRKTIVASLKKIKHYFFPHIYHEAYMCINATTAKTCPRNLNSYFWTSNFNHDWCGLYETGYRVQDLGGSHKLVKTSYDDHQQSTSPILDRKNREFLATFQGYFETASRPSAVFISTDAEIITSIHPDNLIEAMPKRFGTSQNAVLGFVYINNSQYWIMLKNGSFLKLSSNQVKIS